MGTSRRVQDALVHEIQMIICSDLFLNLRNETLPGGALPRTGRHMTCGPTAQHDRFPLLLSRAAAAGCCSFPYRPGLPGWAADLPYDNQTQ